MLLGIMYNLNGNRIALLYNFNFNFMKQLSRQNLHGKWENPTNAAAAYVAYSSDSDFDYNQN